MSATDTNIYTERFPLKKYTSQESIHMIHTMTNSLINSQYLAVMLETIQRRQYTWSSFLEASLPETLIKQIIGKNGLHLKQFTTKYGVDLIWHDRASNRFFVWGSKSALISTLYALKHHIKRFQVKYATDLDADQSLECSLQNIVIVKEPETFIREREHELLMEQPPQKKFKHE